MIKILTACGTGINSSHQIKDAIEQEMRNRGHDVACDAVIINNITKEMMDSYDIFAQIAKTGLGFTSTTPVVDAGPILYRVPMLANPVYDEIERIITANGLK